MVEGENGQKGNGIFATTLNLGMLLPFLGFFPLFFTRLNCQMKVIPSFFFGLYLVALFNFNFKDYRVHGYT